MANYSSDERKALQSVDRESQKFIQWSFEQIESDSDLDTMIKEVTAEAKKWLRSNRPALRALLFAKMVKGAKEHGAPQHTLKEVDKELEGEYLDLLGWNFIRRYNEGKK